MVWHAGRGRWRATNREMLMYDCMIDDSVSYDFSVYTVWMAEDSPPNNEQAGMLPTNSHSLSSSHALISPSMVPTGRPGGLW